MYLSVPVTPDAETARAWAERELEKSIYHRGETLFDKLGQWFSDRLADLLASTGGASMPPLGYLAGAIVVIVLLIVASRVVIPAVRQRRRGDSATLLDDDTRTAAQIRDAARRAKATGDDTLASLEYYRATVRGCEERVVIDERAGRTAREAARDIAKGLTEHKSGLMRGATVFDELCYGHRAGTRDDVAFMEGLERAVSNAKAPKLVLA